MRVLSLNFGDEGCASSQFRIHAYRDRLRAEGIELFAVPADGFVNWESVAKYDAVIVQKKLLSLGKVRRLRHRARRLIYDIDDAIWQPHGRAHHWVTRLRTTLRLRSIVRAAHLCLVANRELASHLGQWSNRVKVFGMALDETVWKPCTPSPGSGVTLGWSGAPGNLGYLESLEPALIEIQRRHPSTTVKVLCGKAPRFTQLKAEHVPWRQGEEAQVVRTFDIGLLPLPDNPFAAAKSPIKGLQYLASGIPSVATPLAATRELFGGETTARFARTNDEWVAQLDLLLSDSGMRERMGREANLCFLKNYSLSQQAKRLATYLQAT